MKKKIKAIGLLSDGLDSALAAKLMLDQGVEIIAVNIQTPFLTSYKNYEKNNTDNLTKNLPGVKKTITTGRPYIEMIKNPKYGYGKNMNPCIDCRIYMLKKAKSLMKKVSASFIFTGEVVDQRPMSQRRDTLKRIEKDAGLQGLVVRPLSAKSLETTIPEKKGWIDREKMLEIRGRSRKPQIQLAEKLNITFQWPAGGCLLTDSQFAGRLKEAFDHGEDSMEDVRLLKYGRHFRLPSGSKVITGRNEKENAVLLSFAGNKDKIIEITGCGSPISLLKKGDEKDVEIAASICARYSDCIDKLVVAKVGSKNQDVKEIFVKPFTDSEVKALRIK
jgi:tRNA U34 2-thiouridine synthase MnmA/TrmU